MGEGMFKWFFGGEQTKGLVPTEHPEVGSPLSTDAEATQMRTDLERRQRRAEAGARNLNETEQLSVTKIYDTFNETHEVVNELMRESARRKLVLKDILTTAQRAASPWPWLATEFAGTNIQARDRVIALDEKMREKAVVGVLDSKDIIQACARMDEIISAWRDLCMEFSGIDRPSYTAYARVRQAREEAEELARESEE